MDTTNKLYFGDNLKILRGYVPDASVDLIYLDPPFNSSASYNAAALEQKGQKVGALRYASLDVQRLAGVARLESAALYTAQTIEVSAGAVDSGTSKRQRVYFPEVHPEKITISATVQCAFQIL
ncbi:MAG: hypothetical protein ACE145_08315 [Terriglobia bacterium]